MNAEDPATLTFVLIHGTFGYGTPWVSSEEPGSFRAQLRDTLEPEFDVRFEVVSWGEKSWPERLRKDNTLERRFNGAAKLVEHLKECSPVSASNRRYLVAHSHGGSVVMYALKDSSVRDKVSGVVCMSSPFLEYRLVKFNRDLLFFSGILLAMFAATKGNGWLWAYALLYSTVVFTLLVRTRSDSEELKLLEEPEESRIGVFEQRERLKLPTSEQLSNAAGKIPLLVLRPKRDEVGGLFLLTHGSGKVLRGVWQFINVVFRWMLYAYFAMRAGRWLIIRINPDFDMTRVDNIWSTVDAQFMTPLTIFATAVLMGMVIMRWSFAFDSLRWLARLDPRPKIAPWDEVDPVYVNSFSWPRHSGIQPQAPPLIAQWIRRDQLS